MPLYSFECKACERPAEFNIPMSKSPRVGDSIELTSDLADAESLLCERCGANNWTRTWPKNTSGFRFRFRRTSVI